MPNDLITRTAIIAIAAILAVWTLTVWIFGQGLHRWHDRSAAPLPETTITRIVQDGPHAYEAHYQIEDGKLIEVRRRPLW